MNIVVNTQDAMKVQRFLIAPRCFCSGPKAAGIFKATKGSKIALKIVKSIMYINLLALLIRLPYLSSSRSYLEF